MNDVFKGAAAGAIAAVPMTATMELLRRRTPDERNRPLPPERITMNALRKLGVREYFDDEPERLAATTLTHFSYAAATGALYASLFAGRTRDSSAMSSALRGVSFGIAVWTVSYLGLMPAANLLTSATKHPASRNKLMILSHVVWGAALGLLVARLREKRWFDAFGLS